MIQCIICGDVFQPNRKDRTICYSNNCKKERDKIARNKRNLLKIPKASKICSICNVPYTPFHKLQKTCGSNNCIKVNKNLSRKKEEHEFNCKICGVLSWSANLNTKLCGKAACRQQYINDFNFLGGYRNKLKDRAKSKSTVSGFYSDEEIDYIIRARLNNKTNIQIALKLKRTLPSIDKKIIHIFKSAKYISLIEETQQQIDMMKPSKKTRNLQKWNQEIKNYFLKN